VAARTGLNWTLRYSENHMRTGQNLLLPAIEDNLDVSVLTICDPSPSYAATPYFPGLNTPRGSGLCRPIKASPSREKDDDGDLEYRLPASANEVHDKFGHAKALSTAEFAFVLVRRYSSSTARLRAAATTRLVPFPRHSHMDFA
jgi:hypothetical protein